METPSNFRHSHKATSRRAFLADVGMGFTGLALGSMLARDGVVRHRSPASGSRPTVSRISDRKRRASSGFFSSAG
jgi:hypothetical protein